MAKQVFLCGKKGEAENEINIKKITQNLHKKQQVQNNKTIQYLKVMIHHS